MTILGPSQKRIASPHLGRDSQGVPGGGIKKNLPVYTNRLVIENGLSNFYQSPNPFLNAISTILSKPVYTFAGVVFISPVTVRLKK